MTFSDLPYKREHGKAPRGRGCWCFCPWFHHSKPDALDHTVFTPREMTLTEAKRWARLHATDSRSPLAYAGTIVIMP